MSMSTVIGHRVDGSPIYLLQGGSSPEPTPPAPPATPPAPPAPTPTPAPAAPPAGAGYTPPSQAEWEANQRALSQFSTLAAPGSGGEDDEDEDEDGQGGQRPVDRSKSPSWDDFDRMRRSSLKAQRETRKFRAQVEQQQREVAEAQAAARQQAEQQAALLSAAEQARREAEALYRPATIKAAAVPALAGAQARADRLDMIYGLIDQSALRVEGDQVHGLAEQIEAVKARVPEWFTPATPPAPPAPAGPPRSYAPRVTTGDQPPASDQPPTRSADVLARQILGGP